METRMDSSMIAPCGMNCGICLGHLREKNQCQGCRTPRDVMMKTCRECSIVRCEKRIGKEADYCYLCDSFPCARLKALDKRYRTKYGMSMMENLEYIREHGIDTFVEKEKRRWRCDTCGGYICVHRGVLLGVRRKGVTALKKGTFSRSGAE